MAVGSSEMEMLSCGYLCIVSTPNIKRFLLMSEMNPYQNVIDFIDAAVESGELMKWLINLEALPENLRSDHLARMKAQMESNNEPDKIIGVVEILNKPEILAAVNLVIKDVYNSGMKIKKYLKANSNENFDFLLSLVAAV